VAHTVAGSLATVSPALAFISRMLMATGIARCQAAMEFPPIAWTD